ncbi:MAG: hypothetical protein KIH63_005455 [Candidatus Saccharibacteria bacterium]|nr:hypothetical protein [Candidatus Saccharibacteria bacterium]
MRVTTRVNKAAAGGLAAEERLLAALAEHVKLPLMQIARRSELARQNGDYEKHLEIIELTADTALQLLDSYLLSLHLTHRDAVELQPVSIGATLDSVAHALDRIAKDTGTELEIRLSGRFEPVLAHPGALESALVSLGCVLIEAQHTQAAETPNPKLMLAAHRSKNGIVTGLYAGIDTLSQEMLRRGHSLYGRARLAMPELSVDSGAGVFVADSLLSAMASQLRVSHYHSLSGLAATLASTKQLELVVN